MTMRTSSKTVTFDHSFSLKGIDRESAAGSYRVVTDEELIEQLSFPVYRRVSTMIFVPAQASSVEMVSIDPLDLQAAQDRDKAMREGDASSQGARCSPLFPAAELCQLPSLPPDHVQLEFPKRTPLHACEVIREPAPYH
jgi:hypothetical protein